VIDLLQRYCKYYSWRSKSRLGRTSWLVEDDCDQDIVVKLARTPRERFFLANQAHWQAINAVLCANSLLRLETFADGQVLLSRYIKGETLADLIRQQWRGTPDLHYLSNILGQLYKRLAQLHCSGCVHSDLKPGNILYSAQGVTFLDFASARALQSDDRNRAFYSYSPSYSLPMQQRGIGYSRVEHDWYSFLCLVYVAMEGEQPLPDWSNDNPLAQVFDKSIQRFLCCYSCVGELEGVWQWRDRLAAFTTKG
jgi:serine/threonine protein kinase